MWFWLSLIALLLWSGSDLFSKIGSAPSDKNSHFKMVMAVGLVMGLHALYELTFGGVTITIRDILVYLPASGLYIASMVLGYIGLRYIELSVSSPICNSSGALSALLCFFLLRQMPSTWQWVGVALVALGMVALGVVEFLEDDDSRAARQLTANVKYSKSFIALLLPILYCILDALGTFIDTVILREEPTGGFLDSLFPTVLDESVANVAYELTFLFVGILAAIYVLLIKRERPVPRRELPKLLGGVCETAGQFAYIFALGDTSHAGFSAAIISSYCALSVLLSRIFLREKLTLKHYLAILTTFIGIVILGIFDA